MVLLRARLAVTATVVAMVAGVSAGTAPVSAATAKATVVLCQGYAACEAKGYSTHGYRTASDVAYWNNTPGHNCTAYAAYRLTHNGRTSWRPEGFGDARTWGPAMERAGSAVRSTPKAGDIAWWPARYHGSSSLGHVAYVERVYSDGSIRLSADNYQGDFLYQRMYRGGTTWPKGFLRFAHSDGSPQGSLTTATLTNRPGDALLSGALTGYVMDPDEPGYASYPNQRIRVTIDGIEGTDFTFTNTYENLPTSWRRPWNLPQGTFTVTVWGVNQGLGEDRLVGTKVLRLTDPTRTTLGLSDADVRYGQRPTVRPTVVDVPDPDEVRPTGTVTIKDGTRTLATRTVADDGTIPAYTLPTLSRGRHTIRAVFTPGTTAFGSSSASRTLVVR